jgi:hypothetical protein
MLHWRVPQFDGEGQPKGTWARSLPLADRVVVREGEVAQLEVAFDEMVPAPVVFQVSLRGVPRTFELQMMLEVGTALEGGPFELTFLERTDQLGKLALLMLLEVPMGQREARIYSGRAELQVKIARNAVLVR